MDGVRRWMGGGSPAPSIRSTKAISKDLSLNSDEEDSGIVVGRRKGNKPAPIESRNSTEPPTMESVVNSLMSPTVSEEEEAEYQW